MKEKINKFLYKGYHLLAGVLFNVAFMIYVVVDGLAGGSWQQALIGFLFYLPWLLLFIEMYRNHQMHHKAVFVIKLMDGANDKLIEIVERYHKRYGELPPEDEPKSSESEKQNREEPNESDK